MHFSGYMSPEYAMEGLYSTKSDVFSFGVLMLEILTGKKNSHFNEVSSLNLVGQVSTAWNISIISLSSTLYPFPCSDSAPFLSLGVGSMDR